MRLGVINVAEEFNNVYDFLKNDHNVVKGLINDTIDKKDTKNFDEIKTQLEIHMMGEEKYLYPALREKDRAEMNKSYQEHHVGKLVLHELKKTDKDDERWIPKMKVLNDILDHHIDEEENQVFPRAKELLNKDQEQNIFKKIKRSKSLMEKQPMKKILEVR
jgi:hemerythrin superfamily protein